MTTQGDTENGIQAAAQVSLLRDVPFRLENGAVLDEVEVAWQDYGTLNADKSNAILLCHALTGDQFLAGDNPISGRKGWW